MKSDRLGKHLLIVFIIALAAYVGFYQFDKWLRLRHGPWQVTFASDGGTPTLIVSEPSLKIAGVKIAFPSEMVTNFGAPVAWTFDDVSKTNLPFGHVIFHDLTFLPGTMTMGLFGHEIELLPRTLVVNRKEVPWESGKTISLKSEEKLPPDPPKKKGRY
ncbi:MAG: hypothetical protein HY301_19215 [Verrucomicrobia bacterium]|nr:hypothetical protein [Verrucomicrobiota bacterium]